MNSRKCFAVGLLAAVIGAPAAAQQVYKRVDEDGTVEFSDTPFPDGEQIEVEPNVIQTNPVEYTPRAKPEPEKSETEAAGPIPALKEPIPLEQEGNREAVVEDPVPGRALRNAGP